MQGDDGYEADEHPARWRARWGAFILSAGILHEGMRLVQNLAGRHKQRQSWKNGFEPLLRDFPNWFRVYLSALRNKGAFHFDDRPAVITRLRALASQSHHVEFSFDIKQGHGPYSQSTYYALSDILIVMGPMIGSEDLSKWEEISERYLGQMAHSSIGYVQAADSLIVEVLRELGFEPTQHTGKEE